MFYPTNHLPSTGYSTASINTKLDLKHLMLVSEAATLNNEESFIEAICSSAGIPSNQMTVGDFYYTTLLTRINTFPNSRIKWENVVCHVPKITIPEEIWSDEHYGSVLTKHGIQRVTTAPRNKIVELFSAVDAELEKPLDLRQSTDLCRTVNNFELTVELLEDNAIVMKNFLPLDEGYSIPTANLIPEWKLLAKNPVYAKLLPFVVWLDESYGKTIAEKFDALENHSDASLILEKASEYHSKYTHGPAVVMKAPCSCCQNHLQLKPISIGYSLFFI